MKRVFFIMLMSILTIGIVKAQNANRSGFFMELGIEGFVGNTPRTSFSIEDNVMKFKCLNGTAADFGLGGRMRIKSHWAYELKVDTQIPLKNMVDNLVIRLLPVGFRYTSSEIWRNYSLYFHFNFGGVMSANNGIIVGGSYGNLEGDKVYPYFSNDVPEKKIRGFFKNIGYGVGYSVGIGANITQHIYMGGSFNAQILFGCYSRNGKGIINYGIPTYILGYRF